IRPWRSGSPRRPPLSGRGAPLRWIAPRLHTVPRSARPASGHPHDDGDPGELGEELIAVPDRPPVVEEDLQRAPHGDPAHDVEPLVDDLRGEAMADGKRDLTQENASE